MKSPALWQISVATSPEAEEAVVALLERLFAQPASVFQDTETKTVTVTVYSSAETQKSFSKRDALEAGLTYIRDCGLNVAPAKITIGKVRREDWSESWKKYFKTIEIGPRLLIKPSWSKRRPRPSQAVVVLDPGLSFGTGQHATTRFCLKQLVRFAPDEAARRSFLDIGAGSGILLIAAAKLGYSPVRGFDFDPVAVRVAKANARRNRVDHLVSITRGDLTKLPLESPAQFDLICANLLDSLLIQECSRIVNRLKPDGRLVLAGILKTQFDPVRRAYESAGLKLVRSRAEREWKSGLFEMRDGPRAK